MLWLRLARSGLFVLTEVSDWGLVARKIMNDGELNAPVFVSWGAVQTIQTAGPWWFEEGEDELEDEYEDEH